MNITPRHPSFAGVFFILLFLAPIVTSSVLFGQEATEEVFATAFDKGESSDWKLIGSLAAENGEGLKTTARLGYATHRVDGAERADGAWIYKATIFPKGQDDSWIALGFFPDENQVKDSGLTVVFRSVGDDEGAAGAAIFSGPGMENQNASNPSGVIKKFTIEEVGRPPYAVKLVYSIAANTVSLSVNDKELAIDLPLAYEGSPATSPPITSFSFAGVVLFQQHHSERGFGTVTEASLAWTPAR